MTLMGSLIYADSPTISDRQRGIKAISVPIRTSCPD
jgi:hypothetical protein